MLIEKVKNKSLIPNIYFLEPNGKFIYLIINNNKVCLIDVDDFIRIKQHHWGISNRGYPISGTNGKRTRMHEFITGWYKHCDHINRNPLDNRKSNLRYYEEDYLNMANQGLRKNNTTGYSGICKTKNGHYIARVGYKRKKKNLGTYKTIKEAVNARNKFLKENLKGFEIIQEVK